MSIWALVTARPVSTAPEGHAEGGLLSNGFFDEIKVRDFPLRGKACFLH